MIWVQDSQGNTLAVSDVDAGNDVLKLELDVKYGTLTIDLASLGLTSYSQLESVFGIDFFRGDGNADKKMGFYGTLTQINQVLGALKYVNTTDNNDLLSITVHDLGNNGAGNDLYDTETVRLIMNGYNGGCH